MQFLVREEDTWSGGQNVLFYEIVWFHSFESKENFHGKIRLYTISAKRGFLSFANIYSIITSPLKWNGKTMTIKSFNLKSINIFAAEN